MIDDMTKMKTTFASGSGGGNDAGNDRDSLWSTDGFEMLLGICEGPIYGLDGDTEEEKLANLFVDDTAIRDVNGELQFPEAEFILRSESGKVLTDLEDNLYGQSPIAYLLGGNTSPHVVNATLVDDVTLTRTIPAAIAGQYNRVEIRLAVQQLYRATDEGYKSSSAELAIKWRYIGEDWTAIKQRVISDESSGGMSPENGAIPRRVNIYYLGLYYEAGQQGTLVGAWILNIETNKYEKYFYSQVWFQLELERDEWGATISKTQAEFAQFYAEKVAERHSREELGMDLLVKWIVVDGWGRLVIEEDDLVSNPTLLTDKITVEGKTTVGGFVRGYTFTVPNSEKGVELSVTLVGVENDEEFIQRISWLSYETENVGIAGSEAEAEYHAGTAMLHVAALLNSEIQNLPNISGVWKGLLCSVPTNYNPETKTYDESIVWDGEFKTEKRWTDNPFWIAYELVTNTRIGYYRINPRVTIDRYRVYTLAKHADEMLSDGDGGEHARFTFNGVITEKQNGLDLINYILGSANAQAYDDEHGQLVIVADRNTAAVATITPEQCIETSPNVVFTYSHTDLTERPNEIVSSYIDSELDWERQYLGPLVDQNAQDKHGANVLEYESVGCIYAQEAWRKMYFRLISSQTETMSVTFMLPNAGIRFELFDIINIVDPDQDWGISGRILALENKKVTFRDPIYLEESGTFYFLVQTQSDAIETISFTVDRVGFFKELTLSVAPTLDLPQYPAFSIQRENSAPGISKPFRIVSISEVDPESKAVSLTAVEVNRNKHDAADNLLLTNKPSFNFDNPKTGESPQNITVLKQEYVNVKDQRQLNLWLTWDSPSKVYLGAYYELQVFKDGVDTGLRLTTNATLIEVPNVTVGDYGFTVVMVYNDKKFYSDLFKWTINELSFVLGEYSEDQLFTSLSFSFNQGDLTCLIEAEYLFDVDAPRSKMPLLSSGLISGVRFSLIDNKTETLLLEGTSSDGEITYTLLEHLKKLGAASNDLRLEFQLIDQQGEYSVLRVENITADGVPLIVDIETNVVRQSLSASPLFDELVIEDVLVEWWIAKVIEGEPLPNIVDAELIRTAPTLVDYFNLDADSQYLLWARSIGPFGTTAFFPEQGGVLVYINESPLSGEGELIEEIQAELDTIPRAWDAMVNDIRLAAGQALITQEGLINKQAIVDEGVTRSQQLGTLWQELGNLNGLFPITTTNISNNSISTPKLMANSVLADKIAANQIYANHITANAVTADKISANAVIADKIAAGAVVADKLAANSVLASKIAAGAITADKIAAYAITAGKIKALAIEAVHLAANSVTTSKLAADIVLAVDATFTGRLLCSSGNAKLDFNPATGKCDIETTSIKMRGGNGGSFSVTENNQGSTAFIFSDSSGYSRCYIPEKGGIISQPPASYVPADFDARGYSDWGLYISNRNAANNWRGIFSPGGVSPFTGRHICIVKTPHIIEVGDLVSRARVVVKSDISNSISEVKKTETFKEKNVYGVYSEALTLATYLNSYDQLPLGMTWEQLSEEFDMDDELVTINSVGEGLINVCGLGGNILDGDNLCSSAMAGKAQQQDDDLVYNYTVAESHEDVIFDYPEQVKQIACTYRF